jgi:hypothetical protein
VIAAAPAQTASRVDAERALYRPEVFQYQRSLALGEPVDERPLPTLWCIAPAALLVIIYWLYASATYHPRASGTASRGGGPAVVVVSVSAANRDFGDLRGGEQATIRIGAGTPHRLTVRSSRAAPCAAFQRCVEIEGQVDGPADSLAIPADTAVPAELVLPARAVAR